MKKVLISILIILLVVLAYFAIFNGLSLGNLKILSVEEIIQANDDLTNNIEQAKSLLKKDYPSKKEELSASVTDLMNKKEEYFKLAKISSDKEITKANTEETYLIEYLWTRIGNHATSKGVNIEIRTGAGDVAEANVKNLSITAKGYYVGIMDFVSILENDDKLNFKIENFKMIQEGDILTATFVVRNIRVKDETSTETAQPDMETQTDNNANPSGEAMQNDGSKLDQLTGAIDDTLAPAEDNQ